MRLKGVQIRDHEIKILNVPDDTTIFLFRDINCHTRIQLILNHLKKLLAQKQTFQKFRPYGLGLGAHFVNSILENNNWGIINDKLTKTSNNKHE